MSKLHKRREELYKELEDDLTPEQFIEIQRKITSVNLQIETENNIGTKGYRSDKFQTSSLNKDGNKSRMKM